MEPRLVGPPAGLWRVGMAGRELALRLPRPLVLHRPPAPVLVGNRFDDPDGATGRACTWPPRPSGRWSR